MSKIVLLTFCILFSISFALTSRQLAPTDDPFDNSEENYPDTCMADIDHAMTFFSMVIDKIKGGRESELNDTLREFFENRVSIEQDCPINALFMGFGVDLRQPHSCEEIVKQLSEILEGYEAKEKTKRVQAYRKASGLFPSIETICVNL